MRRFLQNSVMPALVGLAAVFSACSSDNNGNREDDGLLKTRAVSLTPVSEDGITFRSGDVLYISDSKAGARGAVSVLDYDASTGTFRGRLTYLNDDDNMTAFVKFASSDKVSVDTASRVMSIDYRNQSGTQEDAARRSYAYAYSLHPSTLTVEGTPTVKLEYAGAMLRIRNAVGPQGERTTSAYRLYSTLNKASKKTRATTEQTPSAIYPLTTISLFGYAHTTNETGRITVTPTSESSDGYTYMAIPEGTLETPILETQVTDNSTGLSYITRTTVTGDNTTGSATTFSGKTYPVNPSREIAVGDFICGSSVSDPVAIVYSTTTSRAMSINDATGRKSWSTREILPSSLSRYVASNASTDDGGYSIAAYLGETGGSDYPAVRAAMTAFPTPKGVSSQWYLPTGSDWNAFVQGLGGVSSVNALLREAGGDRLQEAKYWTSSANSLTQPYLMEIRSTSSAPVFYAQPLNAQNIVRPAIRY